MGFIATATDPDGRIVSLSRERWEHIIDGHPELVTLQATVIAAVAMPARRALPAGGWPGEEWFYARDVGPTRWLKVGSYSMSRVAPHPDRFPSEGLPMSVTVGHTTFDRVRYDDEADVLYLHVGDPTTAIDFGESPEGHALRYDAEGNLVGITIVHAKGLIDRDGHVTITLPEPTPVQIEAAALATAIEAA